MGNGVGDDMENGVKNGKKRRTWMYSVLMAVCAVVFVTSGGLLIRDLVNNHRQEAAFQEIHDLFPEVETQIPDTGTKDEQPQEMSGRGTADAGQASEKVSGQASEKEENSEEILPLKERIPAAEWKDWWEQQFADRAPVYAALAAKNPDIVGWVYLADTRIDYPVCQTPDDPEYYLHRDINRQESNYGTPFLSSICRLEEPRSSLLLYGHHMKNGQMFASLQNYTEYAYYLEHPYIQFDTTDAPGSYEVAAVVRLDAEGTQVPWQQLLFPSQPEDFADAWQIVQNREYYDTGVTVEAGDEILALVTCEYTQKDGRLMVIARRIL
jgi:sortase B